MYMPTPYTAAPDRYDKAIFRRCGTSGLVMPPISLGLWHNFGDNHDFDRARNILRRAFDLGITQFDLANNYGTPYGSAEENFGRHLARDFRSYRDEMIITTKAGFDMWPGPYGQGGGSRKYVLASLDQSLARMGLDYVDIFYSHRYDKDTPLEETVGALAQAVRSGKALYAGISNYEGPQARRAAELAQQMGFPLIVAQPFYSILRREAEAAGGVFEYCKDLGLGAAVYSPLAQGLLGNRYLDGEVPSGARAGREGSLRSSDITPQLVQVLRSLNEVASARGQSLAQMALAWILRLPEVSSVLIGASSVAQLEDCLAALNNTDFTPEELIAIDALSEPGRGFLGTWYKAPTV